MFYLEKLARKNRANERLPKYIDSLLKRSAKRLQNWLNRLQFPKFFIKTLL